MYKLIYLPVGRYALLDQHGRLPHWLLPVLSVFLYDNHSSVATNEQ